MHRTLFVLALGACSFHTPSPAGSSGDTVDADTGSPTMIDASQPIAGCHTADPNVRLCVDFEAPSLTPMVYDGSPLAHKNDVTTQGIRAMDRNSEHAAQLDSGSTLTIAEAPTLDITGDLTIELWANPQVLPTDRYWMFDNNTQYGMELLADGTVRCDLGNMVIDHPVSIDAGSWVHLACVYASGKLSVYVDGSSVNACRNAPRPPAGGKDGSAIGGNISGGHTVMQKFVGGIDNVAIYATGLQPQAICALANHDDCGPYICVTGPPGL
ncbi:MAG TPA: LamG domain-containing protein [Kofleriaceae bacterium]|nr:LamG domain-containing protein [Kofleriaceae bacterium]